VTDRDESLRRLAEVMEIEVAALDYLAPLDDDAVARLDALVERSLREEDQRVQQALQATLRFLPPPLRGRARKVLFPEGRR
jgi:hypothetical protein